LIPGAECWGVVGVFLLIFRGSVYRAEALRDVLLASVHCWGFAARESQNKVAGGREAKGWTCLGEGSEAVEKGC